MAEADRHSRAMYTTDLRPNLRTSWTSTLSIIIYNRSLNDDIYTEPYVKKVGLKGTLRSPSYSNIDTVLSSEC